MNFVLFILIATIYSVSTEEVTAPLHTGKIIAEFTDHQGKQFAPILQDFKYRNSYCGKRAPMKLAQICGENVGYLDPLELKDWCEHGVYDELIKATHCPDVEEQEGASNNIHQHAYTPRTLH